MRRFITVGYRQDLLQGGLSGVLDHTRWIAALAVAAAHLRNLLFPDASGGAPPLSLPAKIFYFVTLFGTQAVVVFFAVSGLLVGGALIRLFRSTKVNLEGYAIDRAIRLYIVLIPALVLSIALQRAGLTMTCDGADSVARLLANLVSLQNLTSTPLCNNHPLWSLSSEAFFYIVAPILLIVAIDRTALGWLALGLALVLCVLSWSGDVTAPAFGLVLWMVGALPWFVRVELNPVVPLAAFGVVLFASRVHLISNEFITDISLASTFVLFLSCRFPARTGHGAGKRVGATLAAFSYSLYLIHMPLAQAITRVVGDNQDPTRLRSYVIYSGGIAAIFMASWLFGLSFESRTRVVREWLKAFRSRTPTYS